ncbi:UNVERIFIED_CONTAM: hypothetical protein Sangu_0829600 [Sesamum angustifolium]|uniref:Uncharacterized protein n=1 Tax=Sesamum angustifolium TaxID=2727405 RepID=A0AAW2PWC3_9LAMI
MEELGVLVPLFQEVDLFLLIIEVPLSFGKKDGLLPKIPQRVPNSHIPGIRFKMSLFILQGKVRLLSPD